MNPDAICDRLKELLGSPALSRELNDIVRQTREKAAIEDRDPDSGELVMDSVPGRLESECGDGGKIQRCVRQHVVMKMPFPSAVTSADLADALEPLIWELECRPDRTLSIDQLAAGCVAQLQHHRSRPIPLCFAGWETSQEDTPAFVGTEDRWAEKGEVLWENDGCEISFAAIGHAELDPRFGVKEPQGSHRFLAYVRVSTFGLPRAVSQTVLNLERLLPALSAVLLSDAASGSLPHLEAVREPHPSSASLDAHSTHAAKSWKAWKCSPVRS